MHQKNVENLNRILEQFVSGGGPAGCGCAIMKDGKFLYEGYHGYADLETKKPITADTVYRIWSMTKVIICTAAMTLYEQGKFLLNDPLYLYLPDWKDHTIVETLPCGEFHYRKSEGPMLVKHAFTMAVGMPYAMHNSPTAQAMAKVQEELKAQYGHYDLQTELKAMSRVPIAFEPGTHFQYGYGHELVAGLIEAVSGMSVGEYLKKTIFTPLGMESTGYRYAGDMRERTATFYRRGEDGTLSKLTNWFMDDKHEPEAKYEGGGGGLLSTVRDYSAFANLLACGGVYRGQQIIGRKTIDLMRRNQLNEAQMWDFRNQIGAENYLAGYGYGLGVRTMMDPAAAGANTSLGEFGWTGGSGTWTSIDPSERFSVVYMHQMMPNLEEYHHLRVRAAAYRFLD